MLRRLQGSVVGSSSSCALTTGALLISNRSRAVGSPKHKTKFTRINGKRKVEMFQASHFQLKTRLALVPEVCGEWDWDKNDGSDNPEVIGAASVKPFWWICAKCGHSYQSSPERRIIRGKGCPQCEATRVDVNEFSEGVELLPGEMNASLRKKGIQRFRDRSK